MNNITTKVQGAGERRAEVQDRLNSSFYRSAVAPGNYASEGLETQELVTLLKYQAAVIGRDVLDLGVGPGRTARILTRLARSYAAIDYSPLMVAQLKKAMPRVEVYLEDMRDLGRWDDASLDFVLGTNNVLDAVSHVDRLKTLGELWRVLRPEGVLAFSSHNRRYVDAQAGPVLHLTRNPVTVTLNVIRYLNRLRIRARMKPLWIFDDEYALLDDAAHGRALLHYFVDREAQERQLARIGFAMLDVLDRSGRILAPAEMAPESAYLMYVARKVA